MGALFFSLYFSFNENEKSGVASELLRQLNAALGMAWSHSRKNIGPYIFLFWLSANILKINQIQRLRLYHVQPDVNLNPLPYNRKNCLNSKKRYTRKDEKTLIRRTLEAMVRDPKKYLHSRTRNYSFVSFLT